MNSMKTRRVQKKMVLMLFGGSLLLLTACDVAKTVASEYGINIPEGTQSVQTSTPITTGPAIVNTGFENDAAGWKIVGDAQGGYIEPNYMKSGGVSNGYIYAKDDVAGGVWYFAAPSSYLGNKSNYFGTTLRYSLFQRITGSANPFENKDVIFKSGDRMIYFQMNKTEHPRSAWTHYAVQIKANSGWKNQNGNIATEAEMRNVLSNVTEFWIRGEFQTGADEGGLDNVRIN